MPHRSPREHTTKGHRNDPSGQDDAPPAGPRHPTPSPPPRRKTNRPRTHPSTCVHRSQAAGPGDTADLSPRLACPEAGLSPRLALTCAPLLRAPAARIQVAPRTWPRPRRRWDGGPGAETLPFRPPAQGDRGVSSPGSRPCLPPSQRVRFSFTTVSSSPRPQGGLNPKGGGAGPGRRGTYCVLTPGTRGAGTGPSQSTARPGTGEAGAAPRRKDAASRVGQTLLRLPGPRARGGLFLSLSPSSGGLCLRAEGCRPCGSEITATPRPPAPSPGPWTGPPASPLGPSKRGRG